MADIICPQCGHDDRIQRVKAVVAGGLTEMRSSGGYGGLTYSDGNLGITAGPVATSGTATTFNAQRLMPPPKPEEGRSFMAELKRNALTLVLVISGIYSLMICGVFTDTPEGVVMGIPSLFVALLVGRTLNRDRQKYKRIKAEFPIRLAAWELAINRWQRLYYCSRDDIVFDPENGAWCDPADLHDFLYAE